MIRRRQRARRPRPYDPQGRRNSTRVFTFVVVPLATLTLALSQAAIGWKGSGPVPAELARLLVDIYLGMTAIATFWSATLWRRGRP